MRSFIEKYENEISNDGFAQVYIFTSTGRVTQVTSRKTRTTAQSKGSISTTDAKVHLPCSSHTWSDTTTSTVEDRSIADQEHLDDSKGKWSVIRSYDVLLSRRMAIPAWAMKGFEGEIKLLKETTSRSERSHSWSHTGLILEGEAERSATLEKQMQDSRTTLYLDDPG
jgi:hypothetical protein